MRIHQTAPLLLLTAACAAQTGGALATIDAEPLAPRPFSAQQIRDATSVGRTYRFHIEQTGAPTKTYQMRFTKVGEEECTVESQSFNESGSGLGEPAESVSTWTELTAHASYPAAATTITHEPCDVPAGSFECMVYEVREEQTDALTITRAYFAKLLPGAPVRIEVTVNGQRVSRWTLLAHEAGED